VVLDPCAQPRVHVLHRPGPQAEEEPVPITEVPPGEGVRSEGAGRPVPARVRPIRAVTVYIETVYIETVYIETVYVEHAGPPVPELTTPVVSQPTG
jgi:hypothetical protein